jgi:hypothetical protein
MLEMQVVGTRIDFISTQHELARKLHVRELIYDSATLRDRTAHKKYSICIYEQGPLKVWGPGQVTPLILSQEPFWY